MAGSNSPGILSSLRAALDAREAELVEIPLIQPADPFLDMAGEDLRRRIFLTENENGDSLCLRPEFTIPVCRNHIELNAATPKRYAYLGEVFRQRRDGAAEFLQAGIEDLGLPTKRRPMPAPSLMRWPAFARPLPKLRLRLFWETSRSLPAC